MPQFENFSSEQNQNETTENPFFAEAYKLAGKAGEIIAAPYKDIAADFQKDPVHTLVEGTGSIVLGLAAGAAITGDLPPILAGAALGAVGMKFADLIMHGNTCTLNPERYGKLGPIHPAPLFPAKVEAQKK
jgi:hypothetical protein